MVVWWGVKPRYFNAAVQFDIAAVYTAKQLRGRCDNSVSSCFYGTYGDLAELTQLRLLWKSWVLFVDSVMCLERFWNEVCKQYGGIPSLQIYYELYIIIIMDDGDSFLQHGIVVQSQWGFTGMSVRPGLDHYGEVNSESSYVAKSSNVDESNMGKYWSVKNTCSQ